MKSIAYMFALTIGLISLTGCGEHEIDNYSGVDAIFFDQQHKGAANEAWLEEKRLAHQNYTFVNFNTIAGNDSTLSIKIGTTGYVRDYERPFKVEIVSDSTEAIQGEEFEILNPDLSIMPGENRTFVNVKLSKSERMLSSIFKIQLRLVPGEHFILPFGKDGIGQMPLRYGYTNEEVATEYGMNEDPSVHDIFVTAQLSQPKFWINMAPGHQYYLGKYSQKKYELIIKLCGEKFGWTILEYEQPYIAMEKLGMMNRTLTNHLKAEFNKGKEHYVLEEDGTLMWTKLCPWPEGATPDDMTEE